MTIIALTDNVKKILDLNRVCVIVSLDFRKAFDSVPRESLLKKIAAKCKISDLWLRNYLANRYQYVEIHGVRSKLEKNVVMVFHKDQFLDQSFFPYISMTYLKLSPTLDLVFLLLTPHLALGGKRKISAKWQKQLMMTLLILLDGRKKTNFG